MRPPHSSPSRRLSRRRLVVAAAALVLAVAGAGLAVLSLVGEETGDGQQARSVAVSARVVGVAGRLRPAVRSRVARQVRTLVERYVASAYVRREVAFPGFTPGARRLARRDARVTTGRALGGDEVRVRDGLARITVLAPAPRRAAGATAALRVVLDGDEGRMTVRGQLLLTPTRKGWRVFGYRLAAAGSQGRVAASSDRAGDEAAAR